MAENGNSLMQFSSADGGMVVNGEVLTAEELLSIAVNAYKSGRRIIIANVSNKERKLLDRIANTGKGNVLFDLR